MDGLVLLQVENFCLIKNHLQVWFDKNANYTQSNIDLCICIFETICQILKIVLRA